MRAGEDRYDYARGALDEAGAGEEPFALFGRWLGEAREAGAPEPTGFCLATADAEGRPSARFLLLRGFDAGGLRFFSHTDGPKGRDLAANPQGAMAFWWAALERQVRVEGAVERLSEAESDAYWLSRPPGSRAASAASPQSRPIAGRGEIEAEARRLEAEHPAGAPRPATWGGFVLVPARFEFWQGRPSRLHDRILFARNEEAGEGGASWTRSRLAP